MLGQCLNRGCSLMRDHSDSSAGRKKDGTDVRAEADEGSTVTLEDDTPPADDG